MFRFSDHLVFLLVAVAVSGQQIGESMVVTGTPDVR